jgi:hypothetical protein
VLNHDEELFDMEIGSKQNLDPIRSDDSIYIVSSKYCHRSMYIHYIVQSDVNNV